MQYSALTVKPTVLKDEPLSQKEAAKRMGKFLKKVRRPRAAHVEQHHRCFFCHSLSWLETALLTRPFHSSQHDELRDNEATTQEHLHTIKDALEAAAKK